MRYFVLLYMFVFTNDDGGVFTREHESRFISLSACAQYMDLLKAGVFSRPTAPGARLHGYLCFDVRERDDENGSE